MPNILSTAGMHYSITLVRPVQYHDWWWTGFYKSYRYTARHKGIVKSFVGVLYSQPVIKLHVSAWNETIITPQ